MTHLLAFGAGMLWGAALLLWFINHGVRSGGENRSQSTSSDFHDNVDGWRWK